MPASEPNAFAERCSEFATAVAVAAGALTVPTTAIAILALPLLAGDAAPETITAARRAVLELAPLAVSGAIVGALGAILTVRGRYLAPIAVMAFEPIIKTVLIVTAAEALGLEALVLGNLVGSAFAATVLWRLVRREGVPIRPVRPRQSPFLRSVVVLSAPLFVGQGVLQLNPIVDRLMAAPLESGAITILELGYRLFNMPTALLASTLIAPVTATWAVRYASGGWESLRGSVRRAVGMALIAAPPLVVVGVLLRHQLVTAIYGGGEYGPDAVESTADVFGFFIVGLPAQLVIVALATLFLVQGNSMFPMQIALANVTLNVGLNLALRPLFGIGGIAASTTITYLSLCLCYLVAAHRRYGELGLRELKGTAAKVALATLMCGVAAEVSISALPDVTGRLALLAVTASTAGLAMAAYVATLWALGERGVFDRLRAVRDDRSEAEAQSQSTTATIPVSEP